MVEVPGRDELLAERLWQLGAVAIEEQATTLLAGFRDDDAARRAAAAVAGATLVHVADESWRDAWKRHVRPYVVGGVRVAPAWFADPSATVVIDPGEAFGYDHATTRAMLAAVDALVVAGARVLDVGCGSGILAVAAAVAGATDVVAIDVDAAAVTATRANADRNQVGARIVAATVDIASIDNQFDVVLANLGGTAIVVELAAALAARVAPAGRLVVGGLLAGHEQPAIDALHAAGPLVAEDVRRHDGDGTWCTLIFRSTVARRS